MHSPRNALRHSCTAHNAYNLSGALARTFCAGWSRRQEALQPKSIEKTSSGPFSSLESLSDQFGSGVQNREPQEQTSGSRDDQPDSQRDAAPEAAKETERDVVRKGQDEERKLFMEAREEYKAIKRELRECAPTTSSRNKRADEKGMRYSPPTPISAAVLRTEDILRKAKSSSRYQDPDDFWFDRAEEQVRRMAVNPDHRILMQWLGDRVNRLFREDQVKKMSPKALSRWRKLFDYTPRPFRPCRPADQRPELVRKTGTHAPCPWGVPREMKLSSMEHLEVEIARFGAYMEATPAEKQARARVTKDIRNLVESFLRQPRTLTRSMKQRIRTDLFGSETTGLAIAISDLDIRVYYERDDPDNYRLPIHGAMRKLCRAIDGNNDYMLAVYRHGKFEIISCQHKASGIDIQIVCSPDTTTSRGWIRYYLEKLPHLRNLFFVIKTALTMRGLLDVFNGGIGSYGLFWMIVAAVERRSKNPPVTSAEQLRHFLDFYSTFDFTRRGLTISPTPKTFLKHEFASQQIMSQGPRSPVQSYIRAARGRGDLVRAGQWSIGQTRPMQPYLFCLQDPADPVNDLGRKTNAIRHLQASLQQMRDYLNGRMDWIESGKQLPNQPGQSLLAPLVGPCHEVWDERRSKVEEYAVGEGESDDVEEVDDADQAGVWVDDRVENVARDGEAAAAKDSV